MTTRKRVRIALAVLIVVLIGVVAWQVLRPQKREPEYQGKGLRAWLRQTLCGSDYEAQVRAEAAIRNLGTNAIPTLLEMLRQRDSPLASKMILWWGRHIAVRPRLPSFIRFPRWYVNNAQQQNAEAGHGFEILGTNAQQSVTALMEVYQQNISLSSKMGAGGALSAIAMAAPSTVPSFLRWTESTNPSVRLIAVMALSQGRHEPSLVVPALSKSLRDTNNEVRALAAQGLGWYGRKARQTVPALVPLLSDPYRPARIAATNALMEIDPDAAVKAGVK